MNNHRSILARAASDIRAQFTGEGTGHDWFHIQRVRSTAEKIALTEKHADRFIVAMAALLHEVGDYKLEPDRKDRQEEKVRHMLNRYAVPEAEAAAIIEIVTHISYSKNIATRQRLSLEGRIVQDADRLDAMGAIGVVRTLLYTGAHGLPFYVPGVKPRKYASTAEYQASQAGGVQHFYEKLLLLKDQLNTRAAKKIARQRHVFMQKFLSEFFSEWRGEK